MGYVLGIGLFVLSVSVCALSAQAESHEVDYYLNLSDADLFALATQEKIGTCWIQEASTCESCACQFYVKSDSVSWPGKGWPLNPVSGDSTGCVSKVQWGGYTGSMATPDLVHNAAEQLRDALVHPSNPCLGHCDLKR
jgi:hypothetical protein